MTQDSQIESGDIRRSSVSNADTESGFKPSLIVRSVWFLRLLQVRFRFLIAILIIASIVAQWTRMQSLWDRWIWNSNSATSHSVSGAHEFFCPMDPGVVSPWPAICSICNMDLVPRRRADAQLLPEGVTARMQLTPYRIQLAGIRTTRVEAKELQYEVSFTGILKDLSSGEPGSGSLGFEVFPSASDASLLAQPRSAVVIVRGTPGSGRSARTQHVWANAGNNQKRLFVRILLDDPAALPTGCAVIATVAIPAIEVLAADDTSLRESAEHSILCVPESAIVDRGQERLVYVESMPGMFDGTAVKLGRRMGSYYPVLSGLTPGQRVASSGAFLIDAETRLNPSLAAGYFGANSSALTSASATSKLAPVREPDDPENAGPLSAADQRIANGQKVCPVTELPLDAMGGPIPVMIGDLKVFICCAGCERRLRDEPEKYLSKISQNK